MDYCESEKTRDRYAACTVVAYRKYYEALTLVCLRMFDLLMSCTDVQDDCGYCSSCTDLIPNCSSNRFWCAVVLS